jgi:UDP-N-acetyl-D-glucosamine dehydrogenase
MSVMNATAASLLSRIQNRRARAGVVGLGYVGLPLAVEFGRAGLTTIGIDLDQRKVNEIEAGRSYIPDVPTPAVAGLRRTGLLNATTDFSAVAGLDTVNICVPTPLRKTKDPDMSYVVSATEQIAKYLHPGMLVVLESTTYPGTTSELLRPMLESTGLKAGDDFFLAFSPERVDPANPTFNTRNTPKVVGGTTAACAQIASALYATAVDTIVPVSSTQVAEMVKLLENTFRAVNIGLVNELALMCDRMGIDVWEVVDAARTKPFGFMPFYPGPGLGGHCIPIDPFYLSWKAREAGFEARFIELAGHVNASMPHYVADKVGQALNTHRKPVNGASVLILGIAYKRDIDDIRESPALDVMHVLHERGAKLAYCDPHVPALRAGDWPGAIDMTSVPISGGELARYDCVVILTDHTAFDCRTLAADAALIVDTRNALGANAGDHVLRIGAPSEGPGPGSQRPKAYGPRAGLAQEGTATAATEKRSQGEAAAA